MLVRNRYSLTKTPNYVHFLSHESHNFVPAVLYFTDSSFVTHPTVEVRLLRNYLSKHKSYNVNVVYRHGRRRVGEISINTNNNIEF